MATSARSYAAAGVTAPLDQASTTLASGIIASDLTISLASGGGARFPQPYNGTTTSGGTSSTLNCTGISATIGGSAQVYSWIWNKTDGSWAVITAVSANSLTTTALLGGSTNLWNNGDAWVIDPFVVTFATQSTSVYGVISDTMLEEALCIGRAADTLTIASGGRGFNGTTAAAFSSGAAVQLRVTTPVHEGLRKLIAEVHKQNDTNATNISTNTTNITNLQTGAFWYVVTSGSANAYVAASPAFGALAAGSNLVVFKANFTNTGSATLAVNGLTAKTIKKKDGATNLAAGDIQSGQIVVVQYDGTNFQMLSPIGQASGQDADLKYVATSSGSRTGSGVSTENSLGSIYTIQASDWAVGTVWRVTASGYVDVDSGTYTLRVKLGSTTVFSVGSVSADGGFYFDVRLVCRSTGGSGTVSVLSPFSVTGGTLSAAGGAFGGTTSGTTTTIDTTTTQAVTVSVQFTATDSATQGGYLHNGLVWKEADLA